MSRFEQPSVGAYRGASLAEYPHLHRRNVGDFEASMRKERGAFPSFDAILSRHLEQAGAQGRQQVTVVDFGGGEAYFSRQFLADPSVGTQSRAMLARNPQLRLQFISITDARTQEEFMQPQPLAPLDGTEVPDNSQISAVNIPYTVTSSQSLKQLIEAQSIGSIDIGIAMGFLSHLRPVVFEQTLRDTVDALRTRVNSLRGNTLPRQGHC